MSHLQNFQSKKNATQRWKIFYWWMTWTIDIFPVKIKVSLTTERQTKNVSLSITQKQHTPPQGKRKSFLTHLRHCLAQNKTRQIPTGKILTKEEKQTLLIKTLPSVGCVLQISWIRQRDLHILTSGPHTYTSDSRVEVVPNSDQWTLRIVSTRPSDRGRYECQVNTEPKMMRAVMLDVRRECLVVACARVGN